MKRLLLLICLALCGVAFAFSQNYQEVVYLKNGSVVRGVVVEQIPNVSLKIQTSDGSVFVYDMSEVEKIVKEVKQRQYNWQTNNNDFQLCLKKGYHPNGYRGFVEFGGVIGIGDYGDGVASFSTSHGGQISPYFYLGAGFGVDYHNGWETVLIPLFIDFRVNFLDHKITPYIGAKVGYSFLDIKGAYFNPTFGIDFALDNRLGFNFSLGYNLQSRELYKYHNCWGDRYYDETERVIIGGVTIKFGIYFKS